MKNPSNFLDNLSDALKVRKLETQRRYEDQVIRKELAEHYVINRGKVWELYSNEGIEDPLQELKWAMDGESEFTSLFFKACRGVDLVDLVTKPLDSTPFKVFSDLLDKQRLDALGLIFPVKHRRNWIIHNLGGTRRPGRLYLVIPSKAGMYHDVVIEKLSEFIDDRRLEMEER
jgi:hypothetical protein